MCRELWLLSRPGGASAHFFGFASTSVARVWQDATKVGTRRIAQGCPGRDPFFQDVVLFRIIGCCEPEAILAIQLPLAPGNEGAGVSRLKAASREESGP